MSCGEISRDFADQRNPSLPHRCFIQPNPERYAGATAGVRPHVACLHCCDEIPPRFGAQAEWHYFRCLHGRCLSHYASAADGADELERATHRVVLLMHGLCGQCEPCQSVQSSAQPWHPLARSAASMRARTSVACSLDTPLQRRRQLHLQPLRPHPAVPSLLLPLALQPRQRAAMQQFHSPLRRRI